MIQTIRDSFPLESIPSIEISKIPSRGFKWDHNRQLLYDGLLDEIRWQ